MEITVLLPVYYKDNATYLEEAINSVLNQSLMPSEVLILVDGEIGNELRFVLEQFNNKYGDIVNIKYFKENRGLGLLLNDGVKLAKYDIIARMDSDDVSVYDRLEKQLQYLIDNKADVVGGQVLEFTEDMNTEIGFKKVPCSFEEVVKYSTKRNPINHMSVMFKKQVVINVGNYKDFQGFEDYVLWLEIIKRGYTVVNMPNTLVNVRAGDSMIKRRRGFKYLLKELEVQKYCYKQGYIRKTDLVINMGIRTVIRLIPMKFTKKFYEKILRKK